MNETGPELFIPVVGPSHAGTYSVAVTGGGGTTNSPPAELTVAAPLRISSVTMEGDALKIRFNGIVGRNYILQATTNLLLLPIWGSVGAMNGVPDSLFTVPVSGDAVQSYRVQAP